MRSTNTKAICASEAALTGWHHSVADPHEVFDLSPGWWRQCRLLARAALSGYSVWFKSCLMRANWKNSSPRSSPPAREFRPLPGWAAMPSAAPSLLCVFIVSAKTSRAKWRQRKQSRPKRPRPRPRKWVSTLKTGCVREPRHQARSMILILVSLQLHALIKSRQVAIALALH